MLRFAEPDGEQHQIQIVTDITGTHIEYDEWHNSRFIRTTANIWNWGFKKFYRMEVYYQTPVPQSRGFLRYYLKGYSSFIMY